MVTAWLLLAFWMQTAAANPVSTLTVADAIDNRERYAGRNITVQGTLLVSDEVTALRGSGCETTMSSLDKQFVCAMWLVFPNCKPAESRCTPALKDVLSAIRSQRLSRQDIQVAVRLTGTLRSSRQLYSKNVPPLVPGLPEGNYVEAGFGHMGAFPVQLTVIAGSIVSQVTARPH